MRASGNPTGGYPSEHRQGDGPGQSGSHQSPVPEAGDCEGDTGREDCHLSEHLDQCQRDEAQVALEECDVLYPGSINQEPGRHRCRHPREARFVVERNERWGGRKAERTEDYPNEHVDPEQRRDLCLGNGYSLDRRG